MPLRISLSAQQSFQRCQQLYYYRYVAKLRRFDRPTAPELGNIFHAYLECYYHVLKQNGAALEAHDIAKQHLTTFDKPLRAQAEAARMDGREEAAIEILELPGRAERLADNYFSAHGLHDANRYEILEVELPVEPQLTDWLSAPAVIDLITRDREHGRIALWEHKTTGNVPPDRVRLMDMQTCLYADYVHRLGLYEVDEIIWNYIRTKEPVVPDLVYKGTKREGLTRRQDLDTTWQVYLDAIKAHNLDPLNYQDMRERLIGNEQLVFFPRFFRVVMIENLLNNYIAVAEEINRAESMWLAGSKPIRNLSRDCNWCEFYRLCEAVLTGGDEEDAIAMNFIRRKGEAVANRTH